jgi:Tol biopolymer transport system component
MRLASVLGLAVIVAALGGGASAATPAWNYDLYVVASSGGSPVRLTSDPAHEMFPAVSPDGKQIAYLRDTDDGKAASDIWIMNADGSGQRPLVATSDFERDPAWSPDGRWIAFTSISWSWRVLRIRPDGTGLSEVFPNGRRPMWSRGGKRLALEGFVNPDGEAESLVVVRPDGSNPDEVADGDYVSLASWSADGKSIGFSTQDPDHESRAWIVDVKSERRRRLTKSGYVLLSPRGSSMLVGRKSGYFVLTPGRRASRLPQGKFFTWSPKGARLAYEFRYRDLYVTSADGRTRRRVLSFPRGVPHLPPYVWSPDGRRLYYTVGTAQR